MQTQKQSFGMGKFLDPNAIIEQLRILPGSTIVDFGCGSGYFSLPLAKACGIDGKVYSLDILPSALESVTSKAKVEGISNIFTKRVNLERKNGSGLENDSVDWVILKDMLFQNNNKENIVEEAYRVLRERGKILVVEWNDHEESIGPEMNLRVPEITISEMLKQKGFSDIVAIDGGQFHYAMVAQK